LGLGGGERGDELERGGITVAGAHREHDAGAAVHGLPVGLEIPALQHLRGVLRNSLEPRSRRPVLVEQTPAEGAEDLQLGCHRLIIAGGSAPVRARCRSGARHPPARRSTAEAPREGCGPGAPRESPMPSGGWSRKAPRYLVGKAPTMLPKGRRRFASAPRPDLSALCVT